MPETTAETPFDLELLAAIRQVRDLEESGQVEGGQDKFFSGMTDEELVRSVWVLHDILRGLTARQGFEGMDMLFEAQHNALLAFSMRFAETPLVAVFPEHLRWFNEELHGEDDDA
jgi:hypothetical protein